MKYYLYEHKMVGTDLSANQILNHTEYIVNENGEVLYTRGLAKENETNWMRLKNAKISTDNFNTKLIREITKKELVEELFLDAV